MKFIKCMERHFRIFQHKIKEKLKNFRISMLFIQFYYKERANNKCMTVLPIDRYSLDHTIDSIFYKE